MSVNTFVPASELTGGFWAEKYEYHAAEAQLWWKQSNTTAFESEADHAEQRAKFHRQRAEDALAFLAAGGDA